MSIDDATPSEWDKVSRDISNKLNKGGVQMPQMTIEDFNKGALATAKRVDFVFDLMHSALGIASEAGEFTTSVKAHIVYGKPLDNENLKEELGDLLWFINLACEVLQYDMGEVMEKNIEKLKKRYPEKYSDESALIRRDKVLA